MSSNRYLNISAIGRFGLVGIGATLVHLCVSVLVLAMGLDVYLANLVGFVVAFVFSFLGHSRVTFPDGDRSHLAWARFFLVALMGFGLNNLVLLLSSGHDMEYARLMLAVFVAPLATFVLSALWVFAKRTV
tara:strand:- start:12 stop:404 length:393 start_codon:yes stop_codon:yes gene_type:complete